MPKEAPPRGAGPRTPPDLRDRDQGQHGGTADREPVPDAHVARTRMRGSATPYSTSARRLPSTTITLAMTAAAVTTGQSRCRIAVTPRRPIPGHANPGPTR